MSTTSTTEKIIYVGCYTEKPYAPEQVQYGIHVVKLSNEKLEILSSWEEKNVTYFLVDKARKKLYAVSEAKPPVSALHRFDILDDGTGKLSNHIELDFQESGGCYIGGLRSDRGALIAVAFYNDGVVRLINDESDRLISQPPIVFKVNSGVVKERQEAAHAHAAYPLESGDEFLVPDLGADVIYKLKVHENSAKVVHEIKVASGSGPRHVLKHPQYNLLFVVSELSNKLTVFEVDGLVSNLIQTDQHCTLGDIENSFRVPDDHFQIAAHLQLSRDGKFVLVSNRGRHNSISIFKIVNPKEGKLELSSTVSTHGHFPRFFTIIDDKYLLIANQLSNTLMLFNFNDGKVSAEPLFTLSIPNPAALAIL